jgi:(p)ppGpp synthase/HD superfamily hydrolase
MDKQRIDQIVGKAISTTRYRLLGAAHQNKEWYLAVEALEFAIDGHEGTLRADGVTPYIIHTVEAASYGLTLPNLMRPVATIATLLMHDLMEDEDVRYDTLADNFGYEIADGVAAMSKVIEGTKKSADEYWRDLGRSVIGSIGKPCDRVVNLASMGGVFPPEKQLKQVHETEERILPLIKKARRSFPQQELAYENSKLVLKTQNALLRSLNQNLLAAA